MSEELKCKVCGKLAKDDLHFYQSEQLCNRHKLQLIKHGHFLDNELKINPKRHEWTDEDIRILTEGYKNQELISELSKKLNRSPGSISNMAIRLGLPDKYMKKNNTKYKAPYQDYDWCFERYINRCMSHQEMADELGVTKRVIQKWCVEIHHIDDWTFRKLKHLTDLQRRVIIAGTLGDGHIDNRPDQPMYIESHAIDEKDYLFWKYNILKDICKKEPTYYKAAYGSFGGEKKYLCNPYYRINTRILDDLFEIRAMSKIDKIKQLDSLQVSLLFLDDGNRDSVWHLCVAQWAPEEVQNLLDILKDRFLIRGHVCKDTRYLSFDAISSKRIDSLILENVPNNLDIIKKKIIDNPKIRAFKGSIFILGNDGIKYGVNRYCRTFKYNVKIVKPLLEKMNLDFNEIAEDDLLKILEQNNAAI